jgi:hypothetical protein
MSQLRVKFLFKQGINAKGIISETFPCRLFPLPCASAMLRTKAAAVSEARAVIRGTGQKDGQATSQKTWALTKFFDKK